MAFTSLGVGSGLDSEAIVTKLVAAQRAPSDARLDKIEDTATAKVSAYGQIKAALSGLKDVLAKLVGTGSAMGRLATAASGAGFTATATSSAALGKFKVTVEKLATAHKLQSAQVPVGTQLGNGTLTIKVGTDAPINVNIAAGKGSLTEIRDAINAAAGGAGVTASVVKGDNGEVLMLSSAKTGAAGELTITAAGGDGGLGVLATTGGTLTEISAPEDASVLVDGVRKTSSSNTIDNMIDGVTLTLTKADAGTSFDLDISGDTSTLKASMLSFISAYNTALNQIATQSKSGKDVSGPLSGDAATRAISRDMRKLVSSNYAALHDLGFKTAVDGTLTLDGAKFDAALAATPDAVKSLLGTDGALGKGLRESMTNFIGVDGLVTEKSKSLTDRLEDLTEERDRLDLKMEKVEARLRKQFAALDSIMAQLDGMNNTILGQMNQYQNNSKSK